MNLTPLHPYLLTKSDANRLILLLEKLSAELFKENFTISDALSKDTQYELEQIIEKLVQESGISSTDKNGLQTFFTSLMDEISRLPVVHLILSVDPKKELVETIQSWFYGNFKKTVLLDIAIDPDLIAGCVVSFGGKANDYSLANRIEQLR